MHRRYVSMMTFALQEQPPDIVRHGFWVGNKPSRVALTDPLRCLGAYKRSNCFGRRDGGVVSLLWPDLGRSAVALAMNCVPACYSGPMAVVSNAEFLS